MIPSFVNDNVLDPSIIVGRLQYFGADNSPAFPRLVFLRRYAVFVGALWGLTGIDR